MKLLYILMLALTLAFLVPNVIAEDNVVTTDSLIRVLDEVSLASDRAGKISRLHCRTGDEVQASQIVIEIDSEESQARLEVARANAARSKDRAKHTGKIQVAQSEIDRAQKEVELLDRVGRTPFLEKFRAENDKQKAQSELLAAEEDKQDSSMDAKVKAAELKVAEVDLESRLIRSPFSGSVVKEILRQGEYAEKGKPILRILRMDKLLVQGLVNTADYAPHQVSGFSARVVVQLAQESPIVLSDLTISKVSPEVDLDRNFTVWTELENFKEVDAQGEEQWVLRPGMRATLTIFPASSGESVGSKAAPKIAKAADPSLGSAVRHDHDQ